MYRHTNGRYRSKREVEIERKAKLYTIMTILTFSVVFGLALQPWTATYQALHTEVVYAEVKEVEEEPAIPEPVEPSSEVRQAINALNQALGREVTDETKKRIQYLYDRSVENNVPFFDAFKTIHCESMWTNQKSHLPEESYGLAQIHIPSHNVTVEQAMNAYFAIDFLISHWYTEQAENDTMWFGYSRYTGKCTNGIQIEV